MTDVPPAPPAGPPRAGGRDLTKGPIGRTMLAFALPVLGSSVLQSLNGSINSIWVGRLIGETGLTATVNANVILFFLLSAVFGIGMASTILVGQAFGRRDLAGAKRVVGTTATFFAASSILLSALGYLAADPMLTAMGTPPEAHALAVTYLRIIFIALPFLYFSTFLMMTLRGAGDSRTPFWFMLLATVIDIGLNPLLIAGIGPFPRMGIAGAATATLVAQVIGLAAMLGYIYWRRMDIRLTRADLHLLRPDRALLWATIVKGVPMGLQMIVVSTSGLVMIGIVNAYGVGTAAAYGVAMQLWAYVQMPALAVGAAASSMAAQNVGAQLWARVDRTAGSGIVINLVMTGGLIAAIYLAEHWLIGLFLPGNTAAIAVVERINAIGLWAYVMLGAAFVLFAVVRATGAVLAPLLILVIALLVVRIPLVLALQPRLGVDAVWWSSPVSMIVALALAAAYYRWGRWREARMLPIGAAPALAR